MRTLILIFVLGAEGAMAATDGGFQDVMEQLAQTCSSADAGTTKCGELCPDDGGLNLCRFSDPTLAAVALVVDFEDAKKQRQRAWSGIDPSRKLKVAGTTLPELASVTGVTLTDLATRLIQGLAMVIADRAQRESAAFALEQLFGGLCKGEVRHWFRSTCSLADPGDGGLDLQAYGSGAPAVQLLRTALEADVKAFPAIAGREAVLALIEEDQRQYAEDSALVADTDGGTYSGRGFSWSVGTPPALAKAIEQSVSDLEQGVWVFDALRPVTVQIDAANQSADGEGRLLAPRTQWVACSLSLPSGLFTSAGAYGQLVGIEKTRAELLTALITQPACETLFKQTLFKRVSRLQEVLTLDSSVQPIILATDQGIRRMEAELARAELVSKPKPTADGGVDGPEERRQNVIDLMTASIRVSRAALSLTEVALQAVPTLCPALHPRYGLQLCSKTAPLASAVRLIEIARRELDLADAVIQQDWSSVAIGTTRMGIDFCQSSPVCRERVPRIQGEVNGAIALLSVKTADEAAKVIDSLADPIGEWRGKTQRGRFTVSFTSQAGVSGGVELRYGQYGVLRETGGAYGQAPTLSFPVGPEFAWGFGTHSVSLLISMLDPFAFLQYDVGKDGRLPGARLLTVLAPGLHFRVSLGRSPVGLGAFAVFRPGFRSYDSGLNAPGAHVLQFGLEATVDVTLFSLLRRAP